jgi:hypothetical protein
LLIYLDTSDLINICHGRAPLTVPDLVRELESRRHTVVFSLTTLTELITPLKSNQLLEVRRDLNLIEKLPHTFINEARIHHLEIREAISAFEQGREYNSDAITAFASRLADAVDIYGAPQYIVERGLRIRTEMIVNYRIWDTIDYLWKYDPAMFDVHRRREAEWKWLMSSDRAISDPPDLSDHFVTAMHRDLATHAIQPPTAGIERFARWVYESATRCPGVRLAYETHHRLRKNLTAKTHASDLIDLARISSIPYVDFVVTDKEMMDYCRQAATEIGLSYGRRLGSLRTILCELGIP